MKPVNKFALVFWVVAACFLFADIPMMLAIREFGREIANSQGAKMGSYITLSNIWYETRAALLGTGQLAGLGILIELVDQIRWNSLPLEVREQELAAHSLWWYVRRWPHANLD